MNNFLISSTFNTADKFSQIVSETIKADVETKMNALKEIMLKEVDQYVGELKKSLLERIDVSFTQDPNTTGFNIHVRTTINDSELLK